MTAKEESIDLAYQLNMELRNEQGKKRHRWRPIVPWYTKAPHQVLSEDEYQAMYESQNGQCAICDYYAKQPERLHIDHRHSDGAVRGLLCKHCNLGLG